MNIRGILPWVVFALTPYARAGLTEVHIELMEALSPRDSTSSEHYRADIQDALSIATNLTATRLSACGYRIQSSVLFYEANDQLQAYEKAAEAEKKGKWLIIGPRRSNHYLLVARGAKNTASISVMASSPAITQEGPLHLSIYPSDEKLAHAASMLLSELKVGKKETFFSIVSEDCSSCRDFAKAFEDQVKNIHLAKVGEARVTGEAPELTAIINEVSRMQPDWILVPNYSKVSALIMGSIHARLPKARFIGSDGWGDQNYGFVEDNPFAKKIEGYTVRGFPPAELALEPFELGRAAKKANHIPRSAPGVAVLAIFQGLQDFLCDERPKNASDFRQKFVNLGARYFKSPWEVSIFKLADGKIRFWKRESQASKVAQ